jgi:hypothetical protein
MLPVGFESTISAGERPKTYALDRAGTAGTGRFSLVVGAINIHPVWVMDENYIMRSFMICIP